MMRLRNGPVISSSLPLLHKDFLLDPCQVSEALALGADFIGINNLNTFAVDPGVTLRLAPGIPDNVLVVAESGLGHHNDLRRLADAGVTTFLVGESLMREEDVAAATRRLLCQALYYSGQALARPEKSA